MKGEEISLLVGLCLLSAVHSMPSKRKTDPFIPKYEASQMLRGSHQDRLKRLLTVMSYRADIGDGWEELISFAPKMAPHRQRDAPTGLQGQVNGWIKVISELLRHVKHPISKRAVATLVTQAKSGSYGALDRLVEKLLTEDNHNGDT